MIPAIVNHLFNPLFATASLALAVALTSTSSAQAGGFKSAVTFTDQEKAAHLEALPRILDTAAACLRADLRHHEKFYRKYGISPFYGDRGSFSKMSPAQRREHLRELGKNPDLLEQLKPTSCVGLTLKCLGRGFEAGGQADVWKRLKAYTVVNGGDGTALQDGLQKLGWRTLYWNADVSQNEAWDRWESERHPGNKDHFAGMHAYNWRSVVRKQKYYYNHVDDFRSLVNFGSRVPRAIKPVPFFVGTAHMGYHVFPGTFGDIIEGHSTRRLTDPKTLQSAPFNPIGGGGPTDGEYRSGLVAVPPGY